MSERLLNALHPDTQERIRKELLATVTHMVGQHMVQKVELAHAQLRLIAVMKAVNGRKQVIEQTPSWGTW